ncbi:LysR family transcriptional regulator [Azospirillum brasilense]|nr:LysR family transcriptional regulator [Azospirillum brasilense]
MMDWDKLRVFHAVAEAGSFTHAGEALNLSQSAVSRQISALEDSLGVPLFHRHARGLILTQQGELLNHAARDIFAKLSMTQAMLSESKDAAKGPLKVTATAAFGSTWLTPRIGEFLALYPDIQLTLLITDTELDLGMREADVAIRVSPPRQPDLIQRHLMTFRSHLYAHRRYLDRKGEPQTVADLASHDLVTYPQELRPPFANTHWLRDLVTDAVARDRTVLQVNNLYAIFRAVESGLGVGSLPDYLVTGLNDIVRVLPDQSGSKVDAFFVYPEELRHSKRIAVFRDFLVKKVAESQF